MQPSNFPIKLKLDQQPDSYLDLLKWFTENAVKIKDTIWDDRFYPQSNS